MLHTTLGQVLVNEALPPDLQDYNRVLDKKGVAELLRQVALKHPDKYVEISHRLAHIGRNTASEFGGNSFGIAHMSKAKAGRKYQLHLQQRLKNILDRDDLSDEQREQLIIREAGKVQGPQMDEVLKESLAEKNPLAMQLIGAGRGNKMNLSSLRGSDLLYTDHRGDVIPLPVTRSYSEGLSPMEYWAGTYGARQGVMATKFATQDAGFLSKQLNQVAHRLLVTDEDDPRGVTDLRGLPVDTEDPDSEGALLAHDIGGYKRNTVLTPKILGHLRGMGHAKILVRSPLVGGSPDGGVYARDVGVRERGTLPGRGEQVGLTAAQALSEPISQGMLSTKHTGGVAGQSKTVGGFEGINQLIQVPKVFKGGAAHAQDDGFVEGIEDAPAGGKYVHVNGQRHYVAPGYEVKVRHGDKVEAGDPLSDGAANPGEVTIHKGIGEGRRVFTDEMRRTMHEAGMKVNRRNIELLSRGLINHVRLTDEMFGHVPGDVVPYSTLEHLYEPRDGHQDLHPKRAQGMYLERPVLHYTIGTKVRPSVQKELEHFGVDKITVHKEKPPFEPEMIRGMASLQHDPDFMTRMYGSGLKRSLLDAVHRGAVSDESGTSFVPGLARAVDFGSKGKVIQPEPGKPLPPEGEALSDLQEGKADRRVLPGRSTGQQGHAQKKLQKVHEPGKWSLLPFKFGGDAEEAQGMEAPQPWSILAAAKGVLPGEQCTDSSEALAHQKQGSGQIQDHRIDLEEEEPRRRSAGQCKKAGAEERCAGGGEHQQAGSLDQRRRSLLSMRSEGVLAGDAPRACDTTVEKRGALDGERAGSLPGVQSLEGQHNYGGDVIMPRKKPTDRPSALHALDIQPKKKEHASSGFFGSLFKSSLDATQQLKEAMALLDKVADDSVINDGKTVPVQHQPAPPKAPPTMAQKEVAQVKHPTTSVTPGKVNIPQVGPPEPTSPNNPHPSAPPGQVHPARMAGGYQPEAPDWNMLALANSGDPLRDAMATVTAVDPGAASTLTSGSRHVLRERQPEFAVPHQPGAPGMTMGGFGDEFQDGMWGSGGQAQPEEKGPTIIDKARVAEMAGFGYSLAAPAVGAALRGSSWLLGKAKALPLIGNALERGSKALAAGGNFLGRTGQFVGRTLPWIGTAINTGEELYGHNVGTPEEIAAWKSKKMSDLGSEMDFFNPERYKGVADNPLTNMLFRGGMGVTSVPEMVGRYHDSGMFSALGQLGRNVFNQDLWNGNSRSLLQFTPEQKKLQQQLYNDTRVTRTRTAHANHLAIRQAFSNNPVYQIDPKVYDGLTQDAEMHQFHPEEAAKLDAQKKLENDQARARLQEERQRKIQEAEAESKRQDDLKRQTDNRQLDALQQSNAASAKRLADIQARFKALEKQREELARRRREAGLPD